MNDIHSKEFKKKYLKSKIKLRQWENKFLAENGRLPTKSIEDFELFEVKSIGGCSVQAKLRNTAMSHKLKVSVCNKCSSVMTPEASKVLLMGVLGHEAIRVKKLMFIQKRFRLQTYLVAYVSVTLKVDIKASPASVKEYYKLYWKLKTQILEEQILGDDKSVECLVRSKSDCVLKENTNTLKAIKSVEDDGKESEFSTESDEKIKPQTWGNHLNRKRPAPNGEKEKCTLFNDVIAERLFQGTSFKKRNPRKALSFTKKKSNKSEDGIKSFDSQDVSLLASPFSDSQNDMTRESSFSVNESLEESFSVENYCTPNVKALITTSASLSPLLNKSEVKIVEARASQTSQPINLIQTLASDPCSALKPIRSLDAGWVERCIQDDSDKPERKSSDSGFESSLPDSREESVVQNGESSDDDLIANSDNELDDNSRLSCSFLSQKRKSEVSFQNSAQDSYIGDEEKTRETGETHVAKKRKLDPYEFEEEPKTSAKKLILEKKIESGTLNENYIRINLKKKVFVRGKKKFNYVRYKKQEWKNKKKSLGDGKESGGLVQCYKCGETGHFSRYCKKMTSDELLPVDEDEDDDPLPTLEEVEAMAREKAEENQYKKKSVLTPAKPQIDLEPMPEVKPLYQLQEDGSVIKTPPEVWNALEKFGHSEFRPGQEEAVMRILSGKSTLVTIATGGGKSLCYQLPAYLYASKTRCLTLVVSPLVSLMEDQVAGSSSFFKVGCLHTSQTPKQRQSVLDDAKNGKLFALLVSPEAVVSGDSFTGFGSVFKDLPPIAFACIDEVHCVSQWSHNFRPSYLMITKVLKEKLGVTTILGLTATATVSTIRSIVKELDIADEEGVIKDVPLPNNLILSISKDENRDESLLNLLKSPRFKDSDSILIYCTRRDECERLAVLIRTALHDPARQVPTKSKRLSWNAESYHAGMAAARRKQVQKAFMCGNLRIVVATVAFGMGINKQDIRGVIHYNMPKDFESYVQEVGRAGRDGMIAHCHMFLDPKGRDLNELRRHVYSNSVDRHVLRKLLERVFAVRDCGVHEKGRPCEGHEVAFDCNDTIQALDLPEENIHTLLCYLELHPKKFVKVLAPAYVRCRVRSYKGLKALRSAARKCPPLAYACAMNSKQEKEKSVLEFNVIDAANKLSWDSGLVKRELKGLEWEGDDKSGWKKTGIAVDFSDLGFRVCSRGDMTPSELDEALDYLIERVEGQERRSYDQLDVTFSTFDHFACDTYDSSGDDEGQSKELKNVIRKYFETEELSSGIPIRKLQSEDFDEEEVAGDVRVLLCTYRDNTFNGRAVARIFHGIQSPNYPASLWFKCRFWRKHLDKDFNRISRIATREILRMKL